MRRHHPMLWLQMNTSAKANKTTLGVNTQTINMRASLLFAFLFFSTVTIGQNTTQEEFNFLVNGYKTMVESGLDMKKGYSFKDTMAFTETSGGNQYSIWFMNMVRDNDKSLAGILSIVKSNTWNKTYYIGIPAASYNNDIDLSPSTMTSIKNYEWDTNIKTAFLQSLAEYLSVSMTKRYMRKR